MTIRSVVSTRRCSFDAGREYHSNQHRSLRFAPSGRMLTEFDNRYVYEDGVVLEADVAERLGVERGTEFKFWIMLEDVARRVFIISSGQAEAVRE